MVGMDYEHYTKEELIRLVHKHYQRASKLRDKVDELQRRKIMKELERVRERNRILQESIINGSDQREVKQLRQIRHLLVENYQLHKELEECREREDLWITNARKTKNAV